ncbi:MAG: hypothetical protein JWP45_3098 [Mucilaginibacter sp.]|nr:hypothetical protein [Mucilaginibacter sp.]MDB5138990.1 hypothetical protein [Mucilaginibacter sp.]
MGLVIICLSYEENDVIWESLNTMDKQKKSGKNVLRALIEVGFIIFLFYSNLLMGEYDKTGNGGHKSLLWVLSDIFTESNFIIAIVAALIGYVVFEFLRKKFN